LPERHHAAGACFSGWLRLKMPNRLFKPSQGGLQRLNKHPLQP
jgi:hypothetical protein